jgi:Zn-dependent protease
MILAYANFGNPLLWALLIGWIMTVVLHEFAHGIVAYWGGDYTIKERGGLTLNPIQYIDPMMSIILPAVFLLMGGVPLPGGATYIRRDLLRGRFWNCAVSAAGPAMNLLVFLLLCIPLLPSVGWVNYAVVIESWPNPQIFVTALAFSQILSVLLNLVPIPPLDGFGIIAPFLPYDLREKLSTPPWSNMLFFGYVILLWQAPGFLHQLFSGCVEIMTWVTGKGWVGKKAFLLSLS